MVWCLPLTKRQHKLVSTPDPSSADRSPNEAPLNAPGGAVLLAAAIVASFPLQQRFLTDDAVGALSVSWLALADGAWSTPLTSIFLHGGWTHVLMNAAFALAFGTPVARALGRGSRGGTVFFALFIVCGVLSGLGFAAAHWGDAVGAIGASGAVSGFMGAASRLIDWPGRVSPILSPSVLRLGGGWLAVNLLLAMAGFVPGLEGAAVAWEAHLAGFVAGVLLIGPAMRLAGRP